MNAPPATPPPATLLSQSDKPITNDKLYRTLAEIAAKIEPNPSPSKLDGYMTLLCSLCEYFLEKFPEPSGSPWASNTYALKMTKRSIEFIRTVLKRVPGLLSTNPKILETVVSGHIHLLSVIDAWAILECKSGDGRKEAQDFRDYARMSIAKALMDFAKTAPTANRGADQIAVRQVLKELIAVVNDLSSGTSFPARLSLFQGPRLQYVGPGDPPFDGPSIVLKDSKQARRLSLSILCLISGGIPINTDFTTELEQSCTTILSSNISDITPRMLWADEGLNEALLCIVILVKRGRSRLSLFAKCLEQVLQFRMDTKAVVAMPSIDRRLLDCLRICRGTIRFQSKVLQDRISAGIGGGEWQAAGNEFQKCLNIYSELSWDQSRDAPVESSTRQLGQGENYQDSARPHTHSEAQSWRAAISKRLPSELVSAGLEGPETDEQWALRLLHGLAGRCQPPLRPNMRLLMADLSLKFACFLARCSVSRCSLKRQSVLLPKELFNLVLHALANSKDAKASDGWASVFRALDRALYHHNALLSEEEIQEILKHLQNGLAASERECRIATGRCLVSLMQSGYTLGAGVPLRNRIFDIIREAIAGGSDAIRETTIVLLGSLGRDCDPVGLEMILCELVCQLGHESSILRGLSWLQLKKIAVLHGKPNYGLLSAYLSQIAMVAASNLTSKPQILAEAADFLAIPPEDVLSRTLHSTLPCFVISGDLQVIKSIAKETSSKVTDVIFQTITDILPRVFLLPGWDSTENALSFLVKTLQDEVSPTVSTPELRNELRKTLVSSYVVPLFSNLVIHLGTEDPAGVEHALSAFEKVYTVLQDRPLLQPSTTSKRNSRSQVPSILRPYILGIMSFINDALQEVNGHKTLGEKKKILRALTQLVLVSGQFVKTISPQIMATVQSTIVLPELGDIAAETWWAFVSTLSSEDLAPYIASISASIASAWGTLRGEGRGVCRRTLRNVLIDRGHEMGAYLDEVAGFTSIPELSDITFRLIDTRKKWSKRETVNKLLQRITNENETVIIQALHEFKAFLLDHHDWVQQLASGDSFHQDISSIVESLLRVAIREGDGSEGIRLLAYECFGCLGALDPDRLDITAPQAEMIVFHNFQDDPEAFSFAIHLIRDFLVGSFNSTSDTSYQRKLAFTIQELLKFCGFTEDLVKADSAPVPMKVRNRWNSLSKEILHTVSPLLEARYTFPSAKAVQVTHPIYPSQSTYREWVQTWATFLISRVSGENAAKIFNGFRPTVKNTDAGVARHLLPHLVLNVLMGPSQEDLGYIQQEIIAVLADQVNPSPGSSRDKRYLSAQLVFGLMDHLSRWMRFARQELQKRSDPSRRPYPEGTLEGRAVRIDGLLTNINEELLAKAAFESGAFARSLMSFENQIRAKKASNADDATLQPLYDRIHEIYAQLEEPDGMEGIATKVLEPSLEHQIRHHESLGHWTSAQSCWEVRLQQSSDNISHHLGLMRCLRSLGHYDTLLTHISGIVSRNPGWGPDLADLYVEGAMMMSDWSKVGEIVHGSSALSPNFAIARCLTAMQSKDRKVVNQCLVSAYTSLGSAITTTGSLGYRRSYGAILNLHLLHEFQMIFGQLSNRDGPNTAISPSLSRKLQERLASISPTFGCRELVLSARRVAFSMLRDCSSTSEISQTWLDTAKIARKARHSQTAYSAILHAQQTKAPFYFIEQSKLVREKGEPLRALQELENSLLGANAVTPRERRLKAKALLLQAKWMRDAERYPANDILRAFKDVVQAAENWENAHFHLGNYYDQRAVAGKFNGDTVHVAQCYRRSLQLGSKYVFQTVPRLLTLWLDFGATKPVLRAEMTHQFGSQEGDAWLKVKQEIDGAIREIAIWKWFTAFPQIVSRIGHENTAVVDQLSALIARILNEYPRQALWMFMSAVKSQKNERSLRGRKILHMLKAASNENASFLANQCVAMATAFLELCDFPIGDLDSLSVEKHFPQLRQLVPTDLIVPLQESLVASLPPASGDDVTHRPFPQSSPTIQGFSDEIEIMKSLQRPRKITIKGSDGQNYMFLGKPKDDLRKDARVMDLNSIINKLLGKNSESRKRRLRIRTYGIVTLNEECGFIQWVPNTVPLKPVLNRVYQQKNLRVWTSEIQNLTNKIVLPNVTEKDAAHIFVTQVLPCFPPLFHEWFLETFPEPTTWFSSRLAYARTAAVMSMVGFILGLGDRHCENILLDFNTGDVVHVDLNCLFDRGKQFNVPERVPFRLTNNMIDGLGVTGVEGVFRIACEITLGLLRENRNSLMSVLDAFIHDPLVEWEEDRKKTERKKARDDEAKKKTARRGGRGQQVVYEEENDVRRNVDLVSVAMGALEPIRKKLCGMSSTIKVVHTKDGCHTASPEGPDSADKVLTIGAMVEALIREATDPVNLGKAYGGWMAWM